MPRDPFKKGCEEFRSTRRPMLNPEMSRRQVLISGLGLGLSLYSAKAMSFDRVLENAQAQAAAAPNAPILVNVFLPGPEPDPAADPLEIFQGDATAGAFCLSHDALGDDVVGVGGEAGLLAAPLLEQPLG